MTSMKRTDNPALAALRRNVTGRVLSGEAEAIVEIPAPHVTATDAARDLNASDPLAVRAAEAGHKGPFFTISTREAVRMGLVGKMERGGRGLYQ